MSQLREEDDASDERSLTPPLAFQMRFD